MGLNRILTSYPNDARGLKRIIQKILHLPGVTSIERIAYTKSYTLTPLLPVSSHKVTDHKNTSKNTHTVTQENTLLVLLTVEQEYINDVLHVYAAHHPDTPIFYTLGQEYIPT